MMGTRSRRPSRAASESADGTGRRHPVRGRETVNR